MKTMIKYLLPLALLCCKAKTIQNNKIAIVNHKTEICDTCSYKWSDNFSDKELRELCESGKLVIK